MAEIKPIRAYKYNRKYFNTIEVLTSPLFDVVSEKYRNSLYKNALNSIHLSVPFGGEEAAENALNTWNKWKDEHIVEQDNLPAIYVYYQHFTLLGSQKTYCRKGFICNIKISDWEEGIILRHENTIPAAVNDRIDLLEKTQLNVSPTHGLYTDDKRSLEDYMDEAMKNPLYETEDYQGVRDVLAVIHDKNVVDTFVRVLKNKKVILADGHHRYESSLHFMKNERKKNKQHTGKESYNYHMMYLTNSEADDLRIMPTHRVVKKVAPQILKDIPKYFSEDFNVKEIEDAFSLNEIIAGKEHAFGIITKEGNYKIRLKSNAQLNNPWKFPDKIKALDLTVMHYFIIEKILKIKGKNQRKDDNIDFDRSFSDCLTKVKMGAVDMAIITNEIAIKDVKEVCYSGHTLPQKSTYFYPKVICGFLFSSIHEKDFQVPFDPGF